MPFISSHSSSISHPFLLAFLPFHSVPYFAPFLRCSKILADNRRFEPIPPLCGDQMREFRRNLWLQKREYAYSIRRCLRYPAFSRFSTVPAYDRQTDGRTGGADRQTNGRTHDDSIYHASIASCGKKLIGV